MRKPLIAGNWKMNKTVSEAVTFISDLNNLISGVQDVEVVIAPPFLAVYSAIKAARDTNIYISAQDLFWEEKGAYTGAISPGMLADVGCKYVIVGHSERRQYFGENNKIVHRKIGAAIKHGLIPIACVGESIKQRESQETFHIIETQVRECLSGLPSSEIESIVIAYEPVWAIGTGRTATGEQAEEVHRFLRGILKKHYGERSEHTRILYGGSVKPDNIAELMAKPNIDGALVGGASLKAEEFSRIVKFRC